MHVPRLDLSPSPPALHREAVASIARDASIQQIASDPRALATLSVLVGGMVNPATILASLQSQMRNLAIDTQATEVDAASERNACAEENRRVCLEKAEKALAKMRKGMPKWAKKLIGAVLTAVGTIAACVTGGASIALIVVACVLMAAGDIVEAMTERGVIKNEKVGMAVSLACKLVAAACTLGAGGGVADAASTGAQAGQTAATVGQTAATVASTGTQAATAAADVAGVIESVATLVQTTQTLAEAGVGIHNGVRKYQAEIAESDAEEASINADISLEQLGTITEAIADVERRYSRVMSRIAEIVSTSHDARIEAAMGIV